MFQERERDAERTKDNNNNKKHSVYFNHTSDFKPENLAVN